MFLMFVLLFAFANNQATYTITSAQFDQCDSNNKGVLELTLKSENPITVPLDFVLTLTGAKEIQAQCVMESVPTYKPIVAPTEKPVKPGKDDTEELIEIPETGKEATDEKKQSTDKTEPLESTLKDTDETKKSTDKTEPLESTLEDTDETKKTTTKVEEPLESTLDDTEETKKTTTKVEEPIETGLEDTDEIKKSTAKVEEPIETGIEDTDEIKKTTTKVEEPIKTGIEDTDEIKKSTAKVEEPVESNLEDTDVTKQSTAKVEEPVESNLEDTDVTKQSTTKVGEPVESNLEDTDVTKQSTAKAEEPIETTSEATDETLETSVESTAKATKSSDEATSEQSSDFISDTADATDQEALDSTNNLRRLMGSYEYSVTVTCSFEPPEQEGSYKLEKTDSNIEISGDIALSLIPCLSQDQASERANIALSFRQVNKFDKTKFIFWFYALTSHIITDESFTIKFYIYLLKGLTRAPERVEVTCQIQSGANAEETRVGIYPVSFQCSLPEGTSHDEYDSLEIDSSDDVAGFPTNSTFLNPVLTDEAITNGDVQDAADVEIPTFVEIKDDTLNFDLQKGAMEMSIPFTNEDLVKDKIHKTFEIPLLYPSGISLWGKILSFLNGLLNIEFEIKGVIDNQPLIWEQSVISIDGDELFVMPSFKTEAINTDGYTETKEEEEEEELASDKKPEEGSDKSPEE